LQSFEQAVRELARTGVCQSVRSHATKPLTEINNLEATVAPNESYAVVTGGGSGIGRETCLKLRRDGYHIVVADRDLEMAERVAGDCDGSALAVDVTDEGSVVKLFDDAARVTGKALQILVTAAGIGEMTAFMDLTPEIFRRTYDVNVVGTFLCIREAAKRMRPGARICTIASVAGKRGGGLIGTAAYASSKGAVLALTRSAARSLAGNGISVNGVVPGPTKTPMYNAGSQENRARSEAMLPIRRAAEPSELAEAIVWLVSPKASFVLGETLVVDGGLTMD